MRTSITYLARATILFSTILLAACATRPPADASLETARLAIAEAERNDARRYAAQDLVIAQEKLRLAESERKEGNEELSRRLGQQATVDARFALVHAQAERAQASAVETKVTVDTLRNAR